MNEILARFVIFDEETQHWCIRTEDKDGWAHFGLYPTRAEARRALKKIKDQENSEAERAAYYAATGLTRG